MHVYFLLLIFDILGYSIWCKQATIYYNNMRHVVAVVAVGEGLSRLGILSGGPLLSLFDMLLGIGGGSGTWCSPCGVSSPFLIWYASWDRRGFGNLMFSLWGVLPFPYLICLSGEEGVWELDVPLVVCCLLSLFDMLLVIGGDSSIWCSPCGSPS